MAPRRRQAGSATAYDDLDPATRFMFVPHTVTFLLLGGWVGRWLPLAQLHPLLHSIAAGRRQDVIVMHPAMHPHAAGLVALVYFSHPLAPAPRPGDAETAAAVAYSNAKMGVWAMVLVYLGGPGRKQQQNWEHLEQPARTAVASALRNRRQRGGLGARASPLPSPLLPPQATLWCRGPAPAWCAPTPRCGASCTASWSATCCSWSTSSSKQCTTPASSCGWVGGRVDGVLLAGRPLVCWCVACRQAPDDRARWPRLLVA